MWIEFNPNPLGKRIGDCVIRAICAVEGITWDEAYDILVYYGRIFKNLPHANEVWGAYLRDSGFFRRSLPDTCPDCYTVRDFCNDHPKGIYVVGTGTHAIGIIDGNAYDAWDSLMEVPQFYWEART